MATGIAGDSITVVGGYNVADLQLIELRVISAFLAAQNTSGDTQQNLRNDEALVLAQPIPIPSA